MSACISTHGEFSKHEPDKHYICTLCAFLDEDALIGELKRLRRRNRKLKKQLALAGRAHSDALIREGR